jgi:hypothetical protein
VSDFGKCCKDLHDAMTGPPTSFFRVEPPGVLFLTVGFMTVEGGRTGWFDQAVIYCPFCGEKLQDKGEIKTKTDKYIGGPVN